MSDSVKEAQVNAVETIRQEILTEIEEGTGLDERLEHVEAELERMESQAPFNKEEWIRISKALLNQLNRVEAEATDLLDNINQTRGELSELGQMFADEI